MSESEFVICPKCGSVVPKSDSFCGYCGTDIQKNTVPTQQSTKTLPPIQQSQWNQTYTPKQTNEKAYFSLDGEITSENLEAEKQIERYIQLAYILVIISFCIPIFIFSLIALILVMLARRKGASLQRIQTILYLSILSVITDVVYIIILLVQMNVI